MTRPYSGNAPSPIGSAIAIVVLLLGSALGCWIVLSWPTSDLAAIGGFVAALASVPCALFVLDRFERRAFRAWLRSRSRWQTVHDPRVRPEHVAMTHGRNWFPGEHRGREDGL